MKRISDVVYKIQKSPRSKARIIHHDRLRPYRGEKTPTWLDNIEVAQPVPADSHVEVEKPVPADSRGRPSSERAFDERREGPETRRRSARQRKPPAWAKDYGF